MSAWLKKTTSGILVLEKTTQAECGNDVWDSENCGTRISVAQFMCAKSDVNDENKEDGDQHQNSGGFGQNDDEDGACDRVRAKRTSSRR